MVCPVCTYPDANVSNHPTRDASVVDCPQCGQFMLSETARVNLSNIDETLRWKVSAWINEFAPPMVSSADIDRALASAVPSLHHRADRILNWIVREFPVGTKFCISDLGLRKSRIESFKGRTVIVPAEVVASRLIPIGWNRSLDEMNYMVAEVLCKEMGLLAGDDQEWQISPKGLLYLEGRRDTVSSTAFCAMWFNPEVLPLWEQAIEPAVRAAGYEPLRIDAKQHNGKIDDEIMASIRAARFVVSDFTGNRGGVYYEAGFAHGLGLPVIFMCREGDELHFDIRQYNCIFWTPENMEDARERLKNRILATLGQGPMLLQ